MNGNGTSAEALSDKHKEAVKGWVPKARDMLEKEFDAQLKRLGLRHNGKHTPVGQMSLPEADVQTRRRVEALVQHDTLAEGTAKRGYDNVKRELAYTLLNRLVGLKAMECRGLLFIPPPNDSKATPEQTEVITLVPGQAYSRYLRDLRAAGGSRYKYETDADEALLRDGLTGAFRHVTEEIGVLFDPEHEYSSIWPTHAILVKCIKAINGELNLGASLMPVDAYRAADFLGWVYQFFNRTEKKRIRDETKGIPRSSYELAVINQFYTPSWVVKALVDNTLGRLWLQMHPDSALASKAPPPFPGERTMGEPVADYLVPRTGEKIRYQRLTETGEVACFKLASDITLLDPACGTMHFGQYAFELFHRMYLDEIEHAGKPGWPEEPSVKDPQDIPTAIIENNLFGIDIDPRAIQIASLSLLLTAKGAALSQGYSPLDVNICRTNIVVAHGVNLGEERLRELVEKTLNRQGAMDAKVEKLEQRLFSALWENLRFVGELGGLVQVREGVNQVLDDWVEARVHEKGITRFVPPSPGEQLSFGDEWLASSECNRARQLELERLVLGREARQLEEELLSALEAAAGEAAEDPTDRLFAEDTARGLKLLQTLSRSYDVVVMNPPYGAFVPKVKDFVKVAYPLTKNDIYAAFIDRATQLIEPEGYVGALVSSTFMNLKSFEKLRTEILLKRNPLITLLDLGYGILDEATVEAAALVLRGGSR